MPGMGNVSNRTIFCRDNLDVLRGINSDSVDLIYLDPPFNTGKQWRAPIGVSAKGASFKDTWSNQDIDATWSEDYRAEWNPLYQFISGMNFYARASDVSYISYMAIRMIECRRILKPSGSLFYHCDSVMRDYIKVMLDAIFGQRAWVNSIIWCYSGPGKKRGFTAKHDDIFWYAKSADYTNHPLYTPHKSGLHGSGGLGFRDEKYVGDIQALETRGKQMEDWWADITPVGRLKRERTGYPTQKPLALLHRIIRAASNEEDMVLDPFCGCATTCIAAEQLGRQWAGIDVSVKAFDLVRQRLRAEVVADIWDEKSVNFCTDAPARTDAAAAGAAAKWVYVISNKQYPGEYKVGIATDPKARLTAYQTSDPNRGYKLEHKVLTPRYRELEKRIHDTFENRHEWVRASLSALIRALKSAD